jgi:small subunit ribosomal protein S33
MSAVVKPSRLAALKALQCSLFQTAYNPTSARTGAKYLRARLRGPAMTKYYPTILRIADLRKSATGAKFLVDEDEEERIQDVEDKKARGKGAPTKAKDKCAYWFVWTVAEKLKRVLQRRVDVQTASGRLSHLCYFVSSYILLLHALPNIRYLPTASKVIYFKLRPTPAQLCLRYTPSDYTIRRS